MSAANNGDNPGGQGAPPAPTSEVSGEDAAGGATTIHEEGRTTPMEGRQGQTTLLKAKRANLTGMYFKYTWKEPTSLSLWRPWKQ